MSKEDAIKLLKLQTCVLKVNIDCDGCQRKVRKLVQKIDGVYTSSIDPNQGKLTVTGTVDAATIIKKLNKSGKHAELWPAKNGGGNNVQNQQLQKLHLELPKDHGGGKDGGQKVQQQKQQKGFKDLKFPSLKLPFKKDQKAVKFDLPSEDDSDDGSEYDEGDDDYYDDDMDGLDNDFFDDPKMMKPMLAPPHGHGKPNDKKIGGGGGGGGGGGPGANGKKGVEIPVQVKGGNNGNAGGGKKVGGGGGNQNKGGGGHEAKNGGGNNGKGGNGQGGNNGNKGGGGGGPQLMGKPGKMMGMMHPGARAHMPPTMGHMGNIPAVQGLPAAAPGGGAPPGFFHPGMVPPEMMAAAGGNPYQQQQQYLQAMLQQQQQQQRMMMMNNGGGIGGPQLGPMMGYGGGGRPQLMMMPPYLPPPPRQGHGEPFNMFSDENPNGCSIM